MSQTVDELIQGYKAFYKHYFEENNPLYKQLTTQGQRPKVLVIACSDSRVDPALVLKANPGDLFVVRNVANLVPPNEVDSGHHGTSAAIEFAVCGLGVKDIIVFGHTQCGGIQNMLESLHVKSSFSFVERWMDIAQTAAEKTVQIHSHESLDNKVTKCCQYAILQSLENLKTFPFIAERLENKTIALHGWQFDVTQGSIYALDTSLQAFKPLDVSFLG